MTIEKIDTITVEMFDRISEIRKMEDCIEYMVGVKLTDGRNCCFHSVKYIDCDIATGDMTGFCETESEIIVERIPRSMILYRV